MFLCFFEHKDNKWCGSEVFAKISQNANGGGEEGEKNINLLDFVLLTFLNSCSTLQGGDGKVMLDVCEKLRRNLWKHLS